MIGAPILVKDVYTFIKKPYSEKYVYIRIIQNYMI